MATSRSLNVLGALVLLGACHEPAAQVRHAAPTRPQTMSTKRDPKPSDEELRARLSTRQYEVTQHQGTEPPFANEFWNHHEAGLYVDVATGEPLFASVDKFDSGTGWPSFTRPVEEGRVVE